MDWVKKIKASVGWWMIIAVLTAAGLHFPATSLDVQAQESGFVFTAHGDHGPYNSPEMLASLNALSKTGAAFSLGLGDLSYEGAGDEQRWCATIQKAMGPAYPFEIVMGNHEDEDRRDGYIGEFVRYCPDQMNAQGIYGAEYYFDYPAVKPLMRVIMIGADNTWDWDGDGEIDDAEEFDYDSSSEEAQAHLTWLANTIDSARDLAVPWVVVGMHKTCLTAGEKECAIGPELMNLLVEKRVDLILQGHDHTYQRSKQLALGPRCASIPVDVYNPQCVADEGTEGVFAKGTGSIVIISGHFGGREFHDISLDDPEAGYFAKLMGQNGWVGFPRGDGLNQDITAGFVAFEVSESRIVVTHVATTDPTTFSDSFVIEDAEKVQSTPTRTPALEPSSTPLPDSEASPTPSPTPLQAGTYATVALVPVADTYINQDMPDANYGRNTALRADASPDRRGYLRFDTHEVMGTVLRATLRIHVNTASSVGYAVSVVTDIGWAEADLTYADIPAIGAQIATSGPVVADTWTEVDVTAFVESNSLFAIALTTTGNTAISFSSREGAYPPELVIDFLPAPPTATPPPTNTLSPSEALSTLILTPVADTYVHSVNPTANYGQSTSLRVDASPEVRSYLRFESPDVDGTIVRATLRLYAHSASKVGYRVQYVADQLWEETDLTFANAPPLGDIVTLPSLVSADAWTEIDVLEWVTGDRPLSLALTTTSSTAVKYSSREGEYAPELVIEFRPARPSDPTSMATPPLSPTVSSATATPGATATPSASVTPSASATAGATATSGASVTPNASATPGATVTFGATVTPSATATPGATATLGATATPGATATLGATATPR